MDQFQNAVHNMSAAFRRLSRAENPAEIREVVKEIEARIKLAGSLSLKAAG